MDWGIALGAAAKAAQNTYTTMQQQEQRQMQIDQQAAEQDASAGVMGILNDKNISDGYKQTMLKAAQSAGWSGLPTNVPQGSSPLSGAVDTVKHWLGLGPASPQLQTYSPVAPSENYYGNSTMGPGGVPLGALPATQGAAGALPPGGAPSTGAPGAGAAGATPMAGAAGAPGAGAIPTGGEPLSNPNLHPALAQAHPQQVRMTSQLMSDAGYGNASMERYIDTMRLIDPGKAMTMEQGYTQTQLAHLQLDQAQFKNAVNVGYAQYLYGDKQAGLNTIAGGLAQASGIANGQVKLVYNPGTNMIQGFVLHGKSIAPMAATADGSINKDGQITPDGLRALTVEATGGPLAFAQLRIEAKKAHAALLGAKAQGASAAAQGRMATSEGQRVQIEKQQSEVQNAFTQARTEQVNYDSKQRQAAMHILQKAQADPGSETPQNVAAAHETLKNLWGASAQDYHPAFNPMNGDGYVVGTFGVAKFVKGLGLVSTSSDLSGLKSPLVKNNQIAPVKMPGGTPMDPIWGYAQIVHGHIIPSTKTLSFAQAAAEYYKAHPTGAYWRSIFGLTPQDTTSQLPPR